MMKYIFLYIENGLIFGSLDYYYDKVINHKNFNNCMKRGVKNVN